MPNLLISETIQARDTKERLPDPPIPTSTICPLYILIILQIRTIVLIASLKRTSCYLLFSFIISAIISVTMLIS